MILVYYKETSYETRISVLTWTTWQSSRKRLIEKKKKNEQANHIVSVCVLRGKSRQERKREKKLHMLSKRADIQLASHSTNRDWQ